MSVTVTHRASRGLLARRSLEQKDVPSGLSVDSRPLYYRDGLSGMGGNWVVTRMTENATLPRWGSRVRIPSSAPNVQVEGTVSTPSRVPYRPLQFFSSARDSVLSRVTLSSAHDVKVSAQQQPRCRGNRTGRGSPCGHARLVRTEVQQRVPRRPPGDRIVQGFGLTHVAIEVSYGPVDQLSARSDRTAPIAYSINPLIRSKMIGLSEPLAGGSRDVLRIDQEDNPVTVLRVGALV